MVQEKNISVEPVPENPLFLFTPLRRAVLVSSAKQPQDNHPPLVLASAVPVPRGAGITPGSLSFPTSAHFSKSEYGVTLAAFSRTVHGFPWGLSFSNSP